MNVNHNQGTADGMPVEKHPSEALDSFERHVQVSKRHAHANTLRPTTSDALHRRLKHHHKHNHDHGDDHHHKKHHNEDEQGGGYTSENVNKVESAAEKQYWRTYHANHALTEKKRHHHDRKKHRKRINELLANPASIAALSVHGMMIDAGSTGSRLHVYEWDPRVIWTTTQPSTKDTASSSGSSTSTSSSTMSANTIQAVVSGVAHSVPGTESRWTDRLGPGLASFAEQVEAASEANSDDDAMNNQDQDDSALVLAIADYLQPLLDFAKTVLASKQSRWDQFPIFIRATAGMRLLAPNQRSRVMRAVRTVLHNATLNPFAFSDEQASVLSGEEEAAYDWVGVNFLLNDELLQSSSSRSSSDTAVGTTMGDKDAVDDTATVTTALTQHAPATPTTTYGALDMGGASTQISFYEPNEDIMSNLFKLQIGQAKRWNIYAHSFLFYGINAATERFQARLIANKTAEERLVHGIYNPCLPGGGTKQDVRTNIHLSTTGVETLQYKAGTYPSGDGYFQAVLKNDNTHGDADQCLALARDLLHLEKNDWCEFAHKGDCSLAGIYQPRLPPQGDGQVVREFVAFSNYYNVWQFLQLPERATIAQLEQATRRACSMSRHELVEFNKNGPVVDESELDSYCFRSAYALALLHDGYGFGLQDRIRATQVIAGQKVGWALGAMLYEINAMPWRYEVAATATGSTLNEFRVVGEHGRGGAALTFPLMETIFLIVIVLSMIGALSLVFIHRERKLRKLYQYEPIKDVSIEP